MKNLSNDVGDHIASEVTTIATCWKITLVDGQVLGFTNHDVSISYNSVLYEFSSGVFINKEQQDLTIYRGDIVVGGLLNSDNITDEDLLAGRYDNADIEIFQLNYEDLSQGKFNIRVGKFGRIEYKGGKFSVEIIPLKERLDKNIGQLYSPACRAKLGDVQCQVDLADFKETGSITSVTNNRVFVDSSLTKGDDFYFLGKITFTSGANIGLTQEIRSFKSNEITTILPFPHVVEIGDEFAIEAGCDKKFSTCIERFSNAVNFRGEPHIPGVDKVLSVKR